MQLTRRQIITGAAATSATAALKATSIRALAEATPSSLETVGDVVAPAWRFSLRALDDPYTGKLVFPGKLPSKTRVVHAEVMITNDSEQPLDFQTSNIRMLDDEGIEYGAGSAQGAEPKLVSQVLPNGERSRGSVWFLLPLEATLVEIKFYAPPPQLRIPLQ